MINGKFGQVLLALLLIFMPLERFIVSGLGPGDLFFLVFAVTAWLILWRSGRLLAFPLAFPLWLIFIGSLIGTMSGKDIPTASKALLQEVYLYFMLLTIVNSLITRDAWHWFIKTWAIVATFEAILLLADRVGVHLPVIGGGGVKAATLGVAGAGAVGRAVGTFVNANAAGGYMMLTFFVFLASPYPRNRLVRLGMLGLIALGLLATGSVGSTLGLGLGLVVALTVWLLRQSRPALFVVGLGLIVFVFVALLAPTVLAVASHSDSITYSLAVVLNKGDKRLDLWSNDSKLLSRNPLGIGPNVTASLVVIGAHSDYVAYMTERGAIGFIGLILLFGEVLFWLVLSARAAKSSSDYLTIGALLGGLAGLMLMATVHETSHGRPVWLMFALIYLNYNFLRAEVKSRLGQANLQPELASLETSPAGLTG